MFRVHSLCPLPLRKEEEERRRREEEERERLQKEEEKRRREEEERLRREEEERRRLEEERLRLEQQKYACRVLSKNERWATTPLHLTVHLVCLGIYSCFVRLGGRSALAIAICTSDVLPR